MKKIIILTLVVIIIPFVINIFVKQENEINFNYKENTFVRVKRDKLNKIEIIPLEEYVIGVVSGEMPIFFDEEAFKAQAVAARTYVLDKINQNRNNSFDVVDTIQNQVYLDNETLKNNWKDNYIKNINKIRKSVYETAGEYMTYDGKIITAFFFSTSVGKTENSEEIFSTALPYLRSVDSNWDEEVSPIFIETKEINLKDFYLKLNIDYSDTIKYEILETTSTGRIKKIFINDKEYTGSEVAKILNLRSSYFTISQNNDKVMITTKGYGHGVGMSQYGALAMAKKGYKYKEILKYYYQGIDIIKK